MENKDIKEDIDESLDEDSLKIIKEMEAEKAAEKGGKPDIDAEEAGEKPKEEPKKPEEEKPKEEEKKELTDEEKAEAKTKAKAEEDAKPKESDGVKPKRTPKLIPAWEHEVALKKEVKARGIVEQENLTLKEQLASKDQPKEQVDAIKEFAEKHGWEEDAVSDFLKLTGLSSLRKEVLEKLGNIEKTNTASAEQKEFSTTFDKVVAPLIEKDNIPADKVAEVKKIINDLAFTEKYSGNDLDEIYLISKLKGFLDDVIPIKGEKTAEASRGGSGGGGDEEDLSKIDPKDMTDEQFKKFSDAQGDRPPDEWSTP